ncbi:DUF1501 domain-containing protein [Singulisphaera sp. PoT]|uniref:DUF1501 domain-containing protein n=1 Tax=Singulisphaera sp. PoT TaxID=3411797 RepID=UPI003BF47BB6
MSRRRFLGGLATGVGVASQFGFSRFVQPSIAAELQGREKQVLVVWLAGGASQLETWDPKPGTETGGPFRSIETSVPGTRISELMPRTAKLMHHISLARGVNTNENDHAKGQYMMHTGRPEMPGVAHPHFGSMAAKFLGAETNPLPGYIYITPGGGGRTGTEAAYLGPKYAALYLGNGNPPDNTTRSGLVDEKGEALRHDLRRRMNDRFATRRRTAETEAYTTTYEQALLLMKRREVFDVSKESTKDQERYGSHDFGRHCLLARRLLESGVTYVQVSHSNYDTHNENFSFHLEQVGEFDQGFSNLIEDLAARGLLKHTLVVVMSEFGRTPSINYLYGRDHWGTAWSIAMAGCGIKPGMVHGKTNPNGTEVVDGQVNAAQLYHTYLRAVGLNPSEDLDVDGRIIQLGDPAGSAIKDLLA